jgi:hypothetical protein
MEVASFTDFINKIVNLIIANCRNVDRLDIPNIYNNNYKQQESYANTSNRTGILDGGRTAQINNGQLVYLYTTVVNNSQITQVSSVTVRQQLNDFFQSRGLSRLTVMSAKSIMSICANLASFFGARLRALNYTSKGNAYWFQGYFGVLVYFDGNVTYNTTTIVNDLKEPTLADVHDLLNNIKKNLYSEITLLKNRVNYSVTCSSCSSSSCSSCSSSCCSSSSSFIVYQRIG